ncbi:MAG: hypothetical protein OQK35_05660 [Alphaproteobacteria bacterium]|nr:hypothetical protein [Rhodospirillales bacterium]MCW9045801.1 hypothetical protein [Alphaproteobacteria bacterium]
MSNEQNYFENEDENLNEQNKVSRPEFLPEKFWDPEKGEARVDALAQSYSELEKRLGTASDVPGDADGYEIAPPHELLQSSPEVNARLHSAGFSKSQAQLVYNLAHEALMPMVKELSQQMNQGIQSQRLIEHFGGEEKWGHVSHQLETWGKANLPPQVLDALSSSHEGIVALKTMMENDEPSLSNGGDIPSGYESEEGLRKIMADPKYWRDRDPALVKRVQKGFERLYPNKG